MPIKRLGTIVLALTLAVSGIACSNGVSETNGPTAGLDRAVPPEAVEDPGALACEVVPVNVFAEGGSIPFELSCETMESAVVSSLQRTYNQNGCLVGLRGFVRFSNSGNRYRFYSEVNGCWQDGGTLRVCKLGTTQCMSAEFPRLTRIEDSRIPESK